MTKSTKKRFGWYNLFSYSKEDNKTQDNWQEVEILGECHVSGSEEREGWVDYLIKTTDGLKRTSEVFLKK